MDSGRFIFNGYPGNMFLIGNNDPVYRGCRSMLNTDETLKRRPFFCPPEELVDEEYYDDQSPEKKRRLTTEQVYLLERSFEAENKLEPERKSELAKKLGLQPRQVAVWFQNRRARWKTKQLERDFDRLRASYHTLLSDYDNLVKDNEKLKTEVSSLEQKLQAMEVAQKAGQLPENGRINIDVKVEDHLSSGTGDSAVVDEDGRQLIDSGNSYFPEYQGCMGIDGVQSEEEDGAEDLCAEGQSYFTDGFGMVVQPEQQQEEDEQLEWLVLF